MAFSLSNHLSDYWKGRREEEFDPRGGGSARSRRANAAKERVEKYEIGLEKKIIMMGGEIYFCLLSSAMVLAWWRITGQNYSLLL
jgi:hypothetical protein